MKKRIVLIAVLLLLFAVALLPFCVSAEETSETESYVLSEPEAKHYQWAYYICAGVAAAAVVGIAYYVTKKLK